MKLRFLFLAAFVSLMSCTSDDNTDPVNETPDPTLPVEKNLKSVKSYGVYNGVDKLSYDILCENNKINLIKSYIDPDSPIVSVLVNYSYNTGGELVAKDIAYGSNMNGWNSSDSYEYDDQGRLIYVDSDVYFDTTPSSFTHAYTYNDQDNKIVASHNPGGTIYDVFYLNDEGNIIKMEKEDNEFFDSVHEAEYQGNNITAIHSITSYSSDVVYYTYDQDTEVKGEYLNLYKNSYGSLSNIVLQQLGYNIDFLSGDNYRLTESKINSTDVNYYYQYSFDEEGYPTEVRKIYNGNVFQKIVIEYE